ncbi:hypothetical protein MMC17_007493 [Xylographa soralifera]|nr:hypothetical protein [Xylographa soralifera]
MKPVNPERSAGDMPSIKTPYMVFMDITNAAIWLILNRRHPDVLKVIQPIQNNLRDTWQFLPLPSWTDSANRPGSQRPGFHIIQILPGGRLHNSADQYQMALKADEGIFSDRHMRTAAIALPKGYETTKAIVESVAFRHTQIMWDTDSSAGDWTDSEVDTDSDEG